MAAAGIVADDGLPVRWRHSTRRWPALDAGSHRGAASLRAGCAVLMCGDPADAPLADRAFCARPTGRGGSVELHRSPVSASRSRCAARATTFLSSPSPRYLFLAGGIGITPILAMIRAAANRGECRPVVTAAVPEPRWPSSTSSPRPATASGAAAGRDGSADLSGLLGTREPETAVYCCGPEPLLAAVEQLDPLAARCSAPGAVRAKAPGGTRAPRGVRNRPPAQ